MLAHHWTQSAPYGKAPTDFKGNRVMPMLKALENVKMKKKKEKKFRPLLSRTVLPLLGAKNWKIVNSESQPFAEIFWGFICWK